MPVWSVFEQILAYMGGRFMSAPTVHQKSITELTDDYLETWLESFLIDRKVQNLSPGTLYFYRAKLRLFVLFCEARVITRIEQLTPAILREYLLWLEETGHNPGGINACYRAIKTFLIWYWIETDQEKSNPITKVKIPKLAIDPLEPADENDISRMIKTCGRDFHGLRDHAVLLTLLDTGARGAEMVAINWVNLKLTTGAIQIIQGKGRKPRSVYVGQSTRKAIRAYLKTRIDDNPALWVTENGDRLTYWGLRELVERRALKAGVKPPTLHSFRRAFALAMLRAGVDIYTLQELMGHADLQVLKRYLKLIDRDLQSAHRRGSPVDNLKL
jgi:integrase/recombinase XerD